MYVLSKIISQKKRIDINMKFEANKNNLTNNLTNDNNLSFENLYFNWISITFDIINNYLKIETEMSISKRVKIVRFLYVEISNVK